MAETLISIDKTLKAIMVLLKRHLIIQELQMEIQARDLLKSSTEEETTRRMIEILGCSADREDSTP